MTYPSEPPQYGQPSSQYGQQQPMSSPPGQPFSATPAGYHAMPQAPKQRKKWPWIVGVVALVLLAGCIGVSALIFGGTKAAVDSLEKADQNQQGKNAVAGQMNKATKDGKFQFTVTGMKCGVKSVGPAEFGQKAQGEFCLIDVTIKNVGASAELFADSSQKAYDAKGTEFSVDSGAAIYANDEATTFLEEINPGNQVKGKLVFDVPSGTKLTSVVLHESTFTAGVKVPLK